MTNIILFSTVSFILGFLIAMLIFKRKNVENSLLKMMLEFKTAIDDYKNQNAINATEVKEALKGTDTEAIKAATESLTKVFYEISAKMYQQANPGAGMDPNMGANEAQGEVVDDE